MRVFTLPLCLLAYTLAATLPAYGDEEGAISPATFEGQVPQPQVHAQAIERIRKIVLNQGEDARALANLVQLARDLPADATTGLYFDLATDYLQLGKYNQAASVLQQLLNQYPQQPLAQAALLRIVRLYSSGEVAHTQALKYSGKSGSNNNKSFSKYAEHIAGTTILANPTLGDDAALTFQRSVAMRLDDRRKASLGALMKIKRNPRLEPWRTRALAEHWLASDRKDDSPLPVVNCQRTEAHPHLDGVLDEAFWQVEPPVQFAYNDAFLYLAVSYPKLGDQSYAADSQARTYDADLSRYDHVALRLDVDRDFATCYELALDHRGWTYDRCWMETAWNPRWFVAASANDTHWSVEAAIPLDALISAPPQTGDAWAIAFERVLAVGEALDSRAAKPQPADEEFRLLLFE